AAGPRPPPRPRAEPRAGHAGTSGRDRRLLEPAGGGAGGDRLPPRPRRGSGAGSGGRHRRSGRAAPAVLLLLVPVLSGDAGRALPGRRPARDPAAPARERARRLRPRPPPRFPALAAPEVPARLGAARADGGGAPRGLSGHHAGTDGLRASPSRLAVPD